MKNTTLKDKIFRNYSDYLRHQDIRNAS